MLLALDNSKSKTNFYLELFSLIRNFATQISRFYEEGLVLHIDDDAVCA